MDVATPPPTENMCHNEKLLLLRLVEKNARTSLKVGPTIWPYLFAAAIPTDPQKGLGHVLQSARAHDSLHYHIGQGCEEKAGGAYPEAYAD
jgi:hypothetical protein